MMADPQKVRADDSGDGPLPRLDTFTLFPSLAAELRAKIWVEAHPPPRNVAIYLTKYRGIQAIEPCAPLALRIRSPFAHLLVNHEAREVFL
jgi:hypothetical protein